ncbi:hypothetical protein SOVF_088950 [Spinacia oleracea]|nr:hypothetical protein SOVF_088950 [Spinacia oleracea]
MYFHGDWPPDGKFEESLPLHGTEFVRALSFKEYTHSRDGVLNLSTKWPLDKLKPDLEPKTYISYGLLGVGSWRLKTLLRSYTVICLNV